ncbi:spermidine/putrescine ABC transporter substrate-binding protein [Labrys miyagiensis]|uniref:Spermidine/putrescine ABC transporter substrate-binding protein n=1 Tax=Labrys miyagiensis TaxID=346912 RepID=A0ABQ6CQP2_9HYPH|nr:extracellular solute-binding protein [Labrys miyagiensis]GLS22140.1 spermidine/putrescine ABC transporter substrate-binding protein [Labrys miyagiensis]
MSYQINRRRFTVALGGAVLAGAWARPGFADAKEITVLNWKGYGTDESFALKAFADATGITVKHDYFNSEPEMLTKLRTNPGAYDVVLINSARIQQAQGEGLIDPIDFATIPNTAALSPALKEHANLKADGKIYGCSWVWGMNSLAVRKGITTDTWTIFSDPKYAGKLALFDDAVTSVGIGALLTGQDANDPKDLKAVTGALKAMKPNVKLMWSSEDEWNKAFAANAFDISVYWSGAVVRSIRQAKLPVEFVVPKEGAIGWLDSLAVPATSSKKDDALKFINYMIDPSFYKTWTGVAGAPASANQAAMDQLPADDLNRQIHKPEYLTKLTFMSALPDDRRQSFADLWEEVKAFYAK